MLFQDFTNPQMKVNQCLVFSRDTAPEWTHESVTLGLPQYPVRPITPNFIEHSVKAINHRTHVMALWTFDVLRRSSLQNIANIASAPLGLGKLGQIDMWTNETPDLLDKSMVSTSEYALSGTKIALSRDENVRICINPMCLITTLSEYEKQGSGDHEEAETANNKPPRTNFYSLTITGTPALTLTILRALAFADVHGASYWGAGIDDRSFTPFVVSENGLKPPYPSTGNVWEVGQDCIGHYLREHNEVIAWYKKNRRHSLVSTLPYFLHPRTCLSEHRSTHGVPLAERMPTSEEPNVENTNSTSTTSRGDKERAFQILGIIDTTRAGMASAPLRRSVTLAERASALSMIMYEGPNTSVEARTVFSANLTCKFYKDRAVENLSIVIEMIEMSCDKASEIDLDRHVRTIDARHESIRDATLVQERKEEDRSKKSYEKKENRYRYVTRRQREKQKSAGPSDASTPTLQGSDSEHAVLNDSKA